MALLDEAAALGRLEQLDWACRAAALRGAIDAGLRRPVALFVNVEPSAITSPIPDAMADLVAGAAGKLRIVIEITERALRADPAAIFAGVQWIRDRGWEIALDDVGAVRTPRDHRSAHGRSVVRRHPSTRRAPRSASQTGTDRGRTERLMSSLLRSDEHVAI